MRNTSDFFEALPVDVIPAFVDLGWIFEEDKELFTAIVFDLTDNEEERTAICETFLSLQR